MQQNAPLESGIASFLDNFGKTVAQGSANEQKAALKQYAADKLAASKKTLAEDPNKMRAQPNGNTVGGGKNDPQLALARRTIAPINKIETDLRTFSDNIKNPMYATTNPLVVEHYKQYFKEGLTKGFDASKAVDYATQKTFKDAYPEKAAALYKAHASGTVAHVFSTYPQLAKEFPTIAQKYPINEGQGGATPASKATSAPAPAINTQRQPQAMAPMPQPKAPMQPPVQTAQVPTIQPKAPTQAPMQMAQASQMKMPPVGNIPVGPQSAPNTEIPGQGPSNDESEEGLDNSANV